LAFVIITKLHVTELLAVLIAAQQNLQVLLPNGTFSSRGASPAPNPI